MAVLADDDLVKPTQLPKAPAGQQAWIQYEFPSPRTMRAVTLVFNDPGAAAANMFGAAPSIAAVEASDDGQSFRKLADIPADGGIEHTTAFSATKARFFRVTFTNTPRSGFSDMTFDVENLFGDFSGLKPDPNFEISELVLHPAARINRFEEKAAFAKLASFDKFPTPAIPVGDVIRKTDVIDLTSKMQPDARLDWTSPAGTWVLLRFGYSLLGITNHPASPNVAYFYGEDSNITAIYGDHFPDVPEGYNFDYVNADALIHKFSAANGALATSGGMTYRVLALDPRSKQISLPVLRKIDELVEAGAIVVGGKPESDPSLADNHAEFRSLPEKLWGSGSGASLGKGRVYGAQKLSAVLQTLNIVPDFEYTKPKSDTSILFVHRKLADGDLYFVDNRNDRDEVFDASFRVQGKAPEMWHPDTGQIEPASYQSVNGRTTMPLHLEPWGTMFVVLQRPAESPSRTIPSVVEQPVVTIDGPWDVAFEPGRGAPPQVTFDKLISWPDSADQGVKYFSGSATYTKKLQAPADWFRSGAHLWIDLGQVKNLAEVSANGKPLGIGWRTPYRVDATGVLKPGENQIEIKITNGWANRIIGDRQQNATKTYTFTSPKFYKADSPLWPSGLLGPVRIFRTSTE